MKIGRSVTTAVATHAGLTTAVHGVTTSYIAKVGTSQKAVLPLDGADAMTGNLTIGAHKINTTTCLIKEMIANRLGVRTLADDTYSELFASKFIASLGLGYETSTGYIKARATNAAYVTLEARITDGAVVEVARLMGAADPYVQMTLPMVLKPSAIPGTLVEGHFGYETTSKKLVFYNATAAQFLASNPLGAFAVLTFCGKLIAAGNTKYLTVGDGDADINPVPYTLIACPIAGTLKSLHVYIQVAAGDTYETNFTVMINGVAKSITCKIENEETEGSDVTHTEAVALGDKIGIRVVQEAGGTNIVSATASLVIA